MRVGLIIYGSIDTITGGYLYDRHIVDYLRSKNVEVKIFSQPYTNLFGMIKNNFSKELLNEIIKFAPDILLQDEMNFVSLFLFNKKLKKCTNFPVICIVNLLNSITEKNSVLRYFVKKIESIYLQSIDGFIFNSLYTKNSVFQVIGEHKNTILAYPGKDRFQFSIEKDFILQKISNQKLLIIFIGNLFYAKGLHVLLKALATIDNNLWQLSIIGGLHVDLNYTNKILRLINRLQLENNVKILGTLDRTTLKEEIITHHVLAVPSYYESFGMVYAEVMGAGLPVIASKIGGAAEIVTDKTNGFLIPPGDVDMVRKAILTLIENKTLLATMSLASLSTYAQLASWEESMEKIYLFLQRIYMMKRS